MLLGKEKGVNKKRGVKKIKEEEENNDKWMNKRNVILCIYSANEYEENRRKEMRSVRRGVRSLLGCWMITL